MAAYSSALHNVALTGPTLFGQVINKAAQIAGQSISYNSNKYFVLLIITVKRMSTFFFFFPKGNDNRLYLLKFTFYSGEEKKGHVLTKQRPTYSLLQH